MEDAFTVPAVCWSILGELDRAGAAEPQRRRNVLGLTLPQTLEQYDITVTQDEAVKKCSVLACRYPYYRAFSQDCRWIRWTATRRIYIRSLNAYSKDGGLAVLYGNFAENGCDVKTAGVDDNVA